MQVRFHDDPAAFCSVARPRMLVDPVRCSVLATMAERLTRQGVPDGVPSWFATITDAMGEVVGLAMRTHPTPPHMGFAAAMPVQAVDALDAALTARGEVVPAWSGDIDAARELTGRAARRCGGEARVRMHTRLFEARDIDVPPVPPGRLRPADEADLDLVDAWFAAFHHDAEVQGGRVPQEDRTDPDLRLAQMRANIAEGKVWLWEDGGRVVHLTGINPPAAGVRRIGPVYTPAAHRGRGYAGYVVATLSRRALDEGHRVCLYTDQANPVSNALYERLGYRAVGDEAEFVVEQPGPRPGCSPGSAADALSTTGER